MEAGKWIFIIAMGFTTIIYGVITYFIAVKKNYFLLSGYEGRPEEEKEYLQKSGYLDANGRLLIISFWILFITFILGLIEVPLGFEIGIAVFMIHLLAGLFWVQRYEVAKKQKRMRWLTGVLAVATIGFVSWIALDGFTDNSFHITEESFEVKGAYGDEWQLESIQEIELLDELPNIRIKTNGTNLGGLLKGKFRLEDPYGSVVLFVQNNYETTHVLSIETTDELIMISRNTDEETIELYEELKQKID